MRPFLYPSIHWVNLLTFSPPNKLSSAKFLFCFNIQSASMLFKLDVNVVWVSNSLDPDETQSYSASHPYPSYLHIRIYISLVVSSGLRVKTYTYAMAHMNICNTTCTVNVNFKLHIPVTKPSFSQKSQNWGYWKFSEKSLETSSRATKQCYSTGHY